MKHNFFWAVLFLPTLVLAQRSDSINSKLTTTSPLLGGINVTDMVAPIKADGHTFTMQQPVVDVGIPAYKNFHSAHPVLLKTGVRYQGLFLSGEKNIGSDNFHSITVPLLYSYALTSATNISFLASVGLSSDFRQDVKGSDIIYTAGVRVGFHQDRSLKYGVTLIYVNDYSGSYLLPLPDIDWVINKQWTLNGIVPARASLKYKFSGSQSLGVTVGFSGGSYGLNDTKDRKYLQLRQFSSGFIYDVNLGKSWKINLIAAHSLSQKLQTFTADQKVSLNNFKKLKDRVPIVNYDKNSFVFQAGIAFQF